jgi:hypothetical protein
MNRSAVSERSLLLSDRLDALASALRDAGISPERASRLLATAAAATLDAVALDLLRDAAAASAPVRREHVAVTPPHEQQPVVRLAA